MRKNHSKIICIKLVYLPYLSILILSSHIRLGLPNGVFPSGFPTKTMYTPLLSSKSATCPAHFTLLDFISRTILSEVYRSFSSSLYSFLHSPFTLSFLGPNILLNALFSNILSPRHGASSGCGWRKGLQYGG